MTPLVTAGGIALVLSLSLLGGLGAYMLLWGYDRDFVEFPWLALLRERVGLLAASGLVFGAIAPFVSGRPSLILVWAAFLGALLFSAWQHKVKHGRLYVDALMLLLSAFVPAAVAAAIAATILDMLIPATWPHQLAVGAQWANAAFACIGVLSGPALWTPLVTGYRTARHRLRHHGKRMPEKKWTARTPNRWTATYSYSSGPHSSALPLYWPGSGCICSYGGWSGAFTGWDPH
jgi:hypothetical protein